MALPERYPPGVPCWIDTAQPDPEAAAAFYGGLFGWELEDRMSAGSPARYFVARLGGEDVAAIGSRAADVEGTPAWATYVRVDDADDAAANATAAGGLVLTAPFDVLQAGRMAVLADPSGAVFAVWQAREHKGAGLVNAAGTWNWSNLHTPDAAGAEAFYGEVFGWELMPMGELGMWRVPGYGDVLAARDPDLRRRHAEPGVPEGFSDAIAWLELAAEDATAHWSVTFAVDDTEATARMADALGGTVVVSPFDAGGAMVAVLRDPQGAEFSVSRWAPQ